MQSLRLSVFSSYVHHFYLLVVEHGVQERYNVAAPRVVRCQLERRVAHEYMYHKARRRRQRESPVRRPVGPREVASALRLAREGVGRGQSQLYGHQAKLT